MSISRLDGLRSARSSLNSPFLALDDVLVVDLLALLRADAAMLDLRAVADVDLLEVDGLGLGGGKDLDGDEHGSEGDGAVPDRARHAARPTRPQRASSRERLP